MEKTVPAFIFSRLDVCNGVFKGLCEKSGNQNTAAGILNKTEDHINPVLKSSDGFLSNRDLTLKIQLLVLKLKRIMFPKWLICGYLTNHPDPPGCLGLVSFLFPESEPNIEDKLPERSKSVRSENLSGFRLKLKDFVSAFN